MLYTFKSHRDRKEQQVLTRKGAMLTYKDNMDICASITLTSDDKANRVDNELMTHARAVLAILNKCQEELEVVRETLMTRRGYIDSVIWQINETTITPTLVIAE